jgi:putative transposase
VLWLDSVRDAVANRIIGWAIDPRATTALVLTTLNHALRSRDVRAGQLIHRSIQGLPVHRAAVHPAPRRRRGGARRPAAPATASTTRCREPVVHDQDRAAVLAGHHIRHPAEAEHALVRYSDEWYNPRRIQAGLGGLSPDEYEAHHRDITDDRHR